MLCHYIKNGNSETVLFLSSGMLAVPRAISVWIRHANHL
jgi:hypothetical protein